MDEFWVCQHCRSLNKAGTGKCYSCRNKYGTRPKEGAPSHKPAAPVPQPQPGQMPDFGAANSAPQPYFSRPVALASAIRTREEITGSSGSSHHLPSPAAAIRRRVSRSLAMRQSVSVGWLGYLAAALFAIVLGIGAVIVMTILPAATYLLQHADANDAWSQLTLGQQGMVEYASIAFVAAGALALLFFSVFVGLSTHNATGLGAEQPMLIPYRAGTCWAHGLWSQARISVGLLVPAFLLWQGYEIPGLVAGIVALEIAHRHLDSGAWLSNPYKQIPDLYDKLGVEGSVSSSMAWIWSGCFRIANVMAIAVSAIPIGAFALFTLSALTDRPDLFGWQSAGLGLGQIVAALLVASLVGWSAISVALLIPISIGLVHRQRVRKTLVRVGRARSWVARPGEGGYSPSGQPARPEHLGGYDEDRIVERLQSSAVQGMPGYGGQGGQDYGTQNSPGLGGSVFGGPDPRGPSGPGFGAPATPGSGGSIFDRPRPATPDQASLYSPSTTSSPPWSGEPPVEPD